MMAPDLGTIATARRWRPTREPAVSGQARRNIAPGGAS